MAFTAYLHPYMRALFTLLSFTSTALALKGDSACKRGICVAATVDGDVATYQLTSTHDPLGWIAVGFGRHMVNAPMVIMWKNDDGTTTLSQRYTTAYNEPQPEEHPARIASVSPPNASFNYPEGSSSVSFQVPANQSLLASGSPAEDLIFAFSQVRPDKDPKSAIQRHQLAGHFKLDFTKDFALVTPDAPATSSSSPAQVSKPASTGSIHATLYQGSNMAYKRVEKLILLHAFFVSLGFLVILPAGSLIGRWGRAFTPKWFKAHQFSNFVVAAPVITLGVLLGPAIVYNKDSFRIHFANAHEVYGIVLLFVYYAQVLLGRYIHNRRVALAVKGPITRNHPPLNVMHICLGVCIIGLSFFQVRSGMEWWEILTGRGPITSWALPLWKVWAFVLPVAYFAGYALLPRQLRQEQAAAYATIPDEGSLEEQSQTAHLLAEEHDRDPSL